MSQITPDLRRRVVQISAELGATCDERTPEGRNVVAAIETLMVAMDERCIVKQPASESRWREIAIELSQALAVLPKEYVWRDYANGISAARHTVDFWRNEVDSIGEQWHASEHAELAVHGRAASPSGTESPK